MCKNLRCRKRMLAYIRKVQEKQILPVSTYIGTLKLLMFGLNWCVVLGWANNIWRVYVGSTFPIPSFVILVFEMKSRLLCCVLRLSTKKRMISIDTFVLIFGMAVIFNYVALTLICGKYRTKTKYFVHPSICLLNFIYYWNIWFKFPFNFFINLVCIWTALPNSSLCK